jgi:hypothetical protein
MEMQQQMEKQSEQLVECPGCGLKLPNQQAALPHSYNASGECYQKYMELSCYTIGKQDINFIHQLMCGNVGDISTIG